MRPLKYVLYRNKLSLPVSLPPELRFSVAKSQSEYIEALKILYDCYIEKGFTSPNEHKIRITPYHLLPTSTVILAHWENELIGTITLIRDNPLGLPLESIFKVDHLRQGNKVLCEVSALAIRKEFRGQSGEVFHPLIRFMWNYALRYFGVDYLVIAVNPSMYELYESIYLFEPLERLHKVDAYNFANNNPAVGESINLKNSFDRFSKQYKNAPSHRNLFQFMKAENAKNEIFPQRQYYSHFDSPVTMRWLVELGEQIADIRSRPLVLDGIAKSFGYLNYQDYQLNAVPKARRVPVTFDVVNFPGAKVVDVSAKGLKMVFDQSNEILKKDEMKTMILNCQISEAETAKVVVEPVWKDKQNRSGFRVVDGSVSWQKMIDATTEDSMAEVTKVAA